MEPMLPPHLAPPDGGVVCRALAPVTIRIDAPADVTCAALLAHIERATKVLVCTAVDAQHVAGRWRATRQGMARVVSCELIEGPLPGLLLSIKADDLEGASTLLQIEGSYIGPSKPLLERRRVQQLAEALRAGLARSVREAVAPVAGRRGELRAAPRQVLALPIRLRVGDTPWLGVTRDMSVAGLGLLVRAAPQKRASRSRPDHGPCGGGGGDAARRRPADRAGADHARSCVADRDRCGATLRHAR